MAWLNKELIYRSLGRIINGVYRTVNVDIIVEGYRARDVVGLFKSSPKGLTKVSA